MVGMDDIESASMSTPLLTTVAKDKYETGRCAAELLLNRLNNGAPAEPQRAVIACTLVERQSAAPLRQEPIVHTAVSRQDAKAQREVATIPT